MNTDNDQAAAVLAGIMSTFGECAEVHPEKQLPMATFILGAIRKGEVPGVWYNQQIATERDALRHERDHLLEKAKEYEGRAIGERCRADKAEADRVIAILDQSKAEAQRDRLAGLLQKLEAMAKASRTGVTVEYVHHAEDGQVTAHGFRVCRYHNLGPVMRTVAECVDDAQAEVKS